MPLKFAIVREDPELETQLIERTGVKAALLVCSGGCTALTLARRFPSLAVTAFDVNPMQLEHLRQKAAASGAELERLNQAGEFEALFRVLRRMVEEFVAPPDAIAGYFRGEAPFDWTRSRYWPAVFSTVFNDPLLHAMFGPDATQHAAPGSYPGYFQRAFERGLSRADGPHNPFLQHVFLGRFLAPPAYGEPVDVVLGSLPEVPSLERFGLFSLSNVFDWSADELAADWGARIDGAARPGAAVIIRQLNNRREVARFFPHFRFDEELGARLLATDRSLFYERIVVGFKT
jgi:S-adenosylmethionine-diacylglycerol 3-amino-3-carboxypropyl transferase